MSNINKRNNDSKIKKNRFFNLWEFEQIIKDADIDPIFTLKKLEEYIKNYPNDYSTYAYYSNILIKLGKLDEAEKYLEKAKEYINDPYINEFKDKTAKLKALLAYDKFKILMYQGKYQEAYDYYRENKKILETKGYNLYQAEMLCLKKLNLLDIEKSESNSYVQNQIIDYSEEDFLDHIKRHLADYNKDLDEPNPVIFAPDFPLEKVLSEIKKYIPSENRINKGTYDNSYCFKYDENGKENNKTVDYIEVITFDKTDKFITLYPTQHPGYNFIDLNYLKEKEEPKVKRISMIDKFNKRYGKTLDK